MSLSFSQDYNLDFLDYVLVWSRSVESEALSDSLSLGGPSPSENGAYLSIR